VSSLPPVSDERPGPLLARGREATVHGLGPGRVLRRYDDARDVTTEVTVMQHVARHGVRVPHVHGVHLDPRGRPTGMVLERLDGPTLVEAALVGDVEPAEAGRTLARLHADLHRVPVAGLPADLGPPAREPGHVVVHLDLHPANVVLTESHGPAVVDWSAARLGSASLDVATTALLLAEVAADEGGDYSSAAQVLLVAFLAAVDHDPLPALDEAVRLRTRDSHLVEGERELVPAAAALVTRYAHGSHS
jgi:aminoglycoside phosphotransferase (APT) family kinase protein